MNAKVKQFNSTDICNKLESLLKNSDKLASNTAFSHKTVLGQVEVSSIGYFKKSDSLIEVAYKGLPCNSKTAPTKYFTESLYNLNDRRPFVQLSVYWMTRLLTGQLIGVTACLISNCLMILFDNGFPKPDKIRVIDLKGNGIDYPMDEIDSRIKLNIGLNPLLNEYTESRGRVIKSRTVRESAKVDLSSIDFEL